MKTAFLPLALAFTLTLASALAPVAGAAGTVTVHFELKVVSHHLPAYKSCDVTVADGANGGDVLDAAASSGCISSWQHDSFGNSRFVTCIDGVCQQTGTFWAFYVNDALPCGGSCGIDDVHLHGGETVSFAYADWFTPFPPFP